VDKEWTDLMADYKLYIQYIQYIQYILSCTHIWHHPASSPILSLLYSMYRTVHAEPFHTTISGAGPRLCAGTVS